MMRNIIIYDLNTYIQTCGFFFMIQYPDEGIQASEPCRVFVGSAGPASLSLPTKLISFCYIGPFSKESPLVRPVVWDIMPDGVKECDAIGFLKAHQIPFRGNWTYLSVRKAEQYLCKYRNCRLGDKGLLRFSKNEYKRKSGFKEKYYNLEYYLSPDSIPDIIDSARSLKSVKISHFSYKEVPDDYLLSPFIKFEQETAGNMEEFRQLFPADLDPRFDFYPVFSGNRHENFACRDHSYRNKNNALILSDFFHDEVQIILAWSLTPALSVPCYVQIQGEKHVAEIPWEADPENTFLVFWNRQYEKYLFEPVAFEKRSDGNFCCCLTDVLKENSIVLKPKGKGEFRKIRKNLQRSSQNISAGPNGFCLAKSTWLMNYYASSAYSVIQYLPDCEICGHKIINISTGLLNDWKDNRLLWLPDSIEQLFRWGGKITEEKLLLEGDVILSRRLFFETEEEIFAINCEKKVGNTETPQNLQVIRKNRVIAEVDVDGLPWDEKAKELINLLHSF